MDSLDCPSIFHNMSWVLCIMSCVSTIFQYISLVISYISSFFCVFLDYAMCCKHLCMFPIIYCAFGKYKINQGFINRTPCLRESCIGAQTLKQGVLFINSVTNIHTFHVALQIFSLIYQYQQQLYNMFSISLMVSWIL